MRLGGCWGKRSSVARSDMARSLLGRSMAEGTDRLRSGDDAHQLRDGVPAEEAPPRRRRRSVRHISQTTIRHAADLGDRYREGDTLGLGGGAAVPSGVPGTTGPGRTTVGGAGAGAEASVRVPSGSAAAVSVPLSS